MSSRRQRKDTRFDLRIRSKDKYCLTVENNTTLSAYSSAGIFNRHTYVSHAVVANQQRKRDVIDLSVILVRRRRSHRLLLLLISER